MERDLTPMTVSVVIPTAGRCEWRAAVSSALRQSLDSVEVIVVNDGTAELEPFDDPRVRLLRAGPGAGGNAARMVGVRAAQGEIIAFLDDDDTWRPTKLRVQLDEVTRRGLEGYWVASARVQRSSGRVWPCRTIAVGEDVADFLFRKRRIIGGQGALHTSTLVFPREVIELVGLREDLRYHQDVDWILSLRASPLQIDFVQAADVLVDVHESTDSVSSSIRGRESLRWAASAFEGVPRRTTADFLLTVTYFIALRSRDWPAVLDTLAHALLRTGPPSLKGLSSIVVLPIKLLTSRR